MPEAVRAHASVEPGPLFLIRFCCGHAANFLVSRRELWSLDRLCTTNGIVSWAYSSCLVDCWSGAEGQRSHFPCLLDFTMCYHSRLLGIQENRGRPASRPLRRISWAVLPPAAASADKSAPRSACGRVFQPKEPNSDCGNGRAFQPTEDVVYSGQVRNHSRSPGSASWRGPHCLGRHRI